MDTLEFDLNHPDLETDRYGRIEEFRSRSFYARTPDNHVVFFNQEDVVEVFRCRDFRFAFNQINPDRSPYLANAIEHELLNMHGPRHERLSRLLKRALRDRVIDGMSETIHLIVNGLIDSFPDHGVIEFCREFADPLPGLVLGPMFGLPYDEVSGLNDWIRIGGRKLDALQSGVGIDEVEQANRNIHRYLRDLIRERRNTPGSDLFSELMIAEIDGDHMTEDELVYLSAELASAGVDTTRAQLPLILNALLQHADQLELLRNNPGLSMNAVDEGMRYAPLPWAIPHEATRGFDYRGIRFEPGDLAFVLIPAANRDPASLQEPNRFDITRGRVRHFSFGHGMHVCPGLRLARMEMSIALQQLVNRLDYMRLDQAPQWEPGQTDRTLKTLRLEVCQTF